MKEDLKNDFNKILFIIDRLENKLMKNNKAYGRMLYIRDIFAQKISDIEFDLENDFNTDLERKLGESIGIYENYCTAVDRAQYFMNEIKCQITYWNSKLKGLQKMRKGNCSHPVFYSLGYFETNRLLSNKKGTKDNSCFRRVVCLECGRIMHIIKKDFPKSMENWDQQLYIGKVVNYDPIKLQKIKLDGPIIEYNNGESKEEIINEYYRLSIRMTEAEALENISKIYK